MLLLYSSYAWGAVIYALGTERLTGAPLRVLRLHDISHRVWRTVVAPLVGHHGGALREQTLGGCSVECQPCIL